MKKILLGITLLLLSSCSLMGNKTPTTFEEYYDRNIHAFIDSTEKTLESLGIFHSTRTSGVFDANVSIPIVLSGSLGTEYEIQSDGQNASFSLTDGNVEYDGLAGSGFLSFEKLGLISEDGNLHILFEKLEDIGFSTAEMREVFTKFDGTWLSWTREDARAGITDPIELQAMTILENLSKMNKKQIQSYLTDYPIWTSTEDMGMSGALHVYRVQLDREKAFTLLDTLKGDLSGTGYSMEEQGILRDQLELVNISGTMAFHPENTDTVEMYLSLLDQSGATLGTISISTEPKKTQIVFGSTQVGAELDYTYTDTDTRKDSILIVRQDSVELGRISAFIEHKDSRFQKFSLEMMAQGITVTLDHTQGDNGKFDGRLLLPVGSISWNGVMGDKKLTALKILGASPLGAMDLDLTSSGEMVSGPFVLRVGEEEVMRAIVGLMVESEKFRFAIDIPQSADSTDFIHTEFGITAKTSYLKKSITAPSGTKPLSEFLTELEKLAPEVFIEESDLDLDTSEVIFDETEVSAPSLQ